MQQPFSASLGFLWTEHSLPAAIGHAINAGFDAVECHFPYAYPAAEVKAALDAHQTPMLSLNTALGDRAGDFGLAALPDRIDDAQQGIRQAIDYANAIGCKNIHVLAGKTTHREAKRVYLQNLHYACVLAEEHDQTILIEAINHRDAPDYHLNTIKQAMESIELVDCANLRLLFDCYHTQITEGEVLPQIQRYLPHIAHIQMAGVPNRAEPDQGTLDYPTLIRAIQAAGYDGYIGAEYRPNSTTEAGLNWLQEWAVA